MILKSSYPIKLYYDILCFVDRASLYNLVNKTTWCTIYSWYIYIYQSLHVSDDYGPIIKRYNCVYATLSTCYSVWMTGMHEHMLLHTSHPHRITSTKCRINTVVSPDDGPIVARNM